MKPSQPAPDRQTARADDLTDEELGAFSRARRTDAGLDPDGGELGPTRIDGPVRDALLGMLERARRSLWSAERAAPDGHDAPRAALSPPDKAKGPLRLGPSADQRSRRCRDDE